MTPEEISDLKILLDLWGYSDNSLVRKAVHEIAALKTRIAELEKAAAFDHAMIQREIETGAFLINGHLATIDRQAAYIKRLEEAFMIAHVKVLALLEPHCGETIIHNSPKTLSEYEQEAREALEELRRKS